MHREGHPADRTWTLSCVAGSSACKRRPGRGICNSPARCAQLTPDVVWDPKFRSGCASRVTMMQPADHRERDDLSPIGGLGRAELRGVLAEREVGSGAVIVLEVLAQDALQVPVVPQNLVRRET